MKDLVAIAEQIAAKVIERRNGRRLRCFDDPECRGVLSK